jgi:GNAT superfamily N-acetyltransferase
MLSAATREVADAYWAGFFGVEAERLRPGEPLVVPHAAELGDYAGMYAQSFGAAPVASLPPALIAEHGARVADGLRGGLVADGRWREIFGERLDASIGPAAVRYADREAFRSADSRGEARLLTEDDRAAVEGLRAAVSAAEWSDGGSEPDATPLLGVFEGGVLAALAGWEVWGGAIAHLSIFSHPGFRGRGHGAAAVSALTRIALERGLVPQYRALETNAHSVAIAQRLGFVPYARSLAVRLAA